jgi:cytoskeletal protein RodZ
MFRAASADTLQCKEGTTMPMIAQLSQDLAAIRQRQGLSLEQIADKTKIRTSWLLAIEEGRWHELPEGIYRRSYIRQYARETGADEHQLLNCCTSA